MLLGTGLSRWKQNAAVSIWSEQNLCLAGLKQESCVLFPWMSLFASAAAAQWNGHVWSLFAFPASSVITGGALEMRIKVFLTCCISGCGQLPIPRALQYFSTRASYVFTPGVCIFWDVTFALKGVDESSPVGSLVSHKSIGHAQLWTAWAVFASLSTGVCSPCLCPFLLQGLTGKGSSLIWEAFLWMMCTFLPAVLWKSTQTGIVWAHSPAKGPLAWGSAVLCSIVLLSHSFTGCCPSLSSFPPP